MNTPAKVLVIEDEKQIRRFVRAALEEEGCQVAEAETMAHGLIEAGSRKPDLLILDLGLPDGNGIDLIRDLRGWSDVPVLILSARSQENDKIDALDAGADDYLTKPFGTGELHARLQALLRRTNRMLPSSEIFETGQLMVDLAQRKVFIAHNEVRITPIEFRLLGILIRQAGLVVTYRQMLQEVWGAEHINDQHYLRIYMGQLRHKLETNPARPRYLLTEVGVGYRLAINDDQLRVEQ